MLIDNKTSGIGGAINRVDGLAKVTGQARYAAEYPVEGMLYGVVVSSGIAKGRILSIYEAAARAFWNLYLSILKP